MKLFKKAGEANIPSHLLINQKSVTNQEDMTEQFPLTRKDYA